MGDDLDRNSSFRSRLAGLWEDFERPFIIANSSHSICSLQIAARRIDSFPQQFVQLYQAFALIRQQQIPVIVKKQVSMLAQ